MRGNLRAFWYVALLAALGCSSADEPSGDRSDRSDRPATAGIGGGGQGGRAGSGVGSFGAQPMPSVPQAGARGPAGQGGLAGGAAECAAITQSAEVTLSPVDIVWIVDGSASMLDETLAVQENITNFANAIAMAGLDAHVVMLASGDIAGPTPLGMDAARYLYVPALVGSNDALLQLLDLYPSYAMFLRPGAALHFVVVSDDESFLPAPDFKAQMEMVAGKPFMFHAIASESVDGLPCVGACGLPIVCGGFAPGEQYYALAEMTGGQKISICTADWSMVFGPLQDAVIESVPLPCDYPIPEPPAGETLDAAKVNLEFVAPNASAPELFPHAAAEDQCGDNRAWFYDDPRQPKLIRMCPSACDAIGGGGTVQIKLGCKTVPLTVM
ncbi:MAG TPA: hypothetical protein VK509_17135 [Polyangiales bacterium]|nr:hypothetical protein [Polyangiales bacterium]